MPPSASGSPGILWMTAAALPLLPLSSLHLSNGIQVIQDDLVWRDVLNHTRKELFSPQIRSHSQFLGVRI